MISNQAQKKSKYGTYQTPLYKTLPPKKKAININTSSKASLYKIQKQKRKKMKNFLQKIYFVELKK
jgi:hypothetical protein